MYSLLAEKYIKMIRYFAKGIKVDEYNKKTLIKFQGILGY